MPHAPAPDPTFDAFLCHAGRDKAAVRALRDRLRDDGFDAWLDEDTIGPGDVILAAIERGLRSSRRVYTCLSGRFTDSEWAREEWQAALHAQLSVPGAAGKVIPVVVADFEPAALPLFLASRRREDARSPDDYRRLVNDLQRARAAAGLRPATPSAQPVTGAPTVPFRPAAPPPPAAPAPPATTAPTSPVHVFVCSAPSDEKLRAELLTHLSPLIRTGKLQVWHTGLLRPGADIQKETHTQLDRARLVLALMSASLLASDDAFALVRSALKRRATVVPILTRPCAWESSELGAAQPLPRNRKAISTWSHPDEAWLEVVRGIEEALAQLQPTP